MIKKGAYRHIAILLIVLLFSNSFHMTASANFEGFLQNCFNFNGSSSQTDKEEKEENNDKGQSGDGQVVGIWTKEGTTANNVAHDLWDYWKNKGFGGAAISGVMGNVAHEGGFDIPDRAEGHYGGDSESNGIGFGNLPVTMAHYPIGKSGKQEGGAGHYQFTPYSKFAPAGDERWLSTEKQSDYVWTSEVGHAKWLNSYMELSSVDEAVAEWFYKYERGMSLNPAKITSGNEAYRVFGGSDVSADSSLANAVDTATKGEEKEKVKKKLTFSCGKAEDESASESKGSKANNEVTKIAESLLGYFTYALIHGEKFIGSVEDIDKNGVTDCSGFVWLVFSLSGYKVPPDMGWFTGSMEDDVRGKQQWLERITPEEAGPGDVVIVTSAGKIGHTAMLLEDWKDAKDNENDTTIIQMGGGSMGGVNKGAFKDSFYSLVNTTHTISFARGISK